MIIISVVIYVKQMISEKDFFPEILFVWLFVIHLFYMKAKIYI